MAVNCNQYLLITAPLIEGEPELTISQSVPLSLDAMMRDLTVEQYCIVYPEWNVSLLTQMGRRCPAEFHKMRWNHPGGTDYASK